MWHMHTHACAKCEYNRIETLNTLIPNSHIVTFVAVLLCKKHWLPWLVRLFSCKYVDLLICFLLNLRVLFNMFVLVWLYENPCILRLIWCGWYPGFATSTHCFSFNMLQYVAWLVVQEHSYRYILREAMLHVFTSTATPMYAHVWSSMPLRVHVHSICIANCFTSCLHPLHPSSYTFAFTTCPNF